MLILARKIKQAILIGDPRLSEGSLIHLLWTAEKSGKRSGWNL